MAQWRDVIQDENYKSLPLVEKHKTKREFFQNTISKSKKYTILPEEEKKKITRDFFIERPEEQLEVTPAKKDSPADIIRSAFEIYQKSPIAVLDKPVEEFAKFIEPETEVAGERFGAAKFIPRQMLAEFVRGYKPTSLGAFMGIAKAAKPVGKLLKPVALKVGEKIPQKVKDKFLKEFTIGKGRPKAYQEMAKEAQLERAIGGREAEEVAQKLTIKPTQEAILAKKTLQEQEGELTGRAKRILEKKALLVEPLTGEEQRYVGRIFRKEIDIGGKKAFISPEESARLTKNVEVEVAFNPKVQSLQKDLELVNKTLRDKEVLAKGLIGKEFRTETGFIEKATGISKVPKIKPSGKPSTKRFDIGVVSKPISPIPPTASPIPAMIAGEEEEIVRGIGQVSKFSTTNKFQNLSRQSLLQQRKKLSKQLQDEIMDIEIGVRSNYQLFDRTFSEQIRLHPKYQQLSAIADEGRDIMDKWSTELAKSGIPKEQMKEIIQENIGSYMRRMHRAKLKPQEGGVNLFKNLRLRLNSLRHRKDLSADVLKAMGEIKEPALPTAISVKEISTSIANNKLFSKVAQNPEWVADTNIGGKLIKMPDTATVGALKGKWVVPEIASDINAIANVGKQAQSLYLKSLSAWKYGKVVLNPATQARNLFSNTVLLDFSGTNHLRQLQLFPQAFEEFLNKGKLYKQMLDDGAIGGEFVGTETMQKLRDFYIQTPGNNIDKWMSIVKMPFKKSGELYQGMEQLSKMVKYIDVLSKGKTRQEAAKEAQEWLFNYNEIPNFIDWVRKLPFGAPFITFCVSADTQILTNRGWKLFDDIKNEDETLAYQMETGQLKWQKIKNVNIFPYNGDMLHIKSRSIDILMTPDHRNIVLSRTHEAGHRNTVYKRKVKLAKELDKSDSIIVSGEYIAPIEKTVDDDMVKLVGWFVTEGYIVTCSRAFCIGQTNKRGQEEIEALRKRLKIDKYNIQLRRYKIGGYKLHKVYYFPSFIRDRVLKLAPNKKLTTEFLKLLTKEQLQILYDVLLLADGCIVGSQPVLIQNQGETADSMQILGVMLGKQFGWCVRSNCLAITVTKGKARQIKRNLPKQINYQGIVWCPQTNYGTRVARRNGKVFITGNTYKAIPRIGEALVNRPMTIYKYKVLFDAVNETSRKYQGMSPVEYAKQKKLLPEWLQKNIGGIPSNLLMPWKDNYKRTQWLNLEYILPIGMAPEILQQGLTAKSLIGNPVFNIISDLSKNSDFRGKPIIPVGSTKIQGLKYAMEYIYRQLVPSLAPGIWTKEGDSIFKGGYSFEKMLDAIYKRPDFAERTRELTPVLFDVLAGIKLNALDVKESGQFKMWNKKKRIEELKEGFYKLKNPALSEKYKSERRETIFKSIQKILEE